MIALDQAGAGLASSRRIEPLPGLNDFVEETWIRRGGRRPERGWRIVVDPCPHLLVVAPHRGRSRRVRLVGPRTRWVDAGTGREFTVAVRFRPGALPRLTGLPASDFTDRSVPFEDVFPRDAERLRGRMGGGDATRVVELLHDFLVAGLRSASAPDWRVRALDPGAYPVRFGPGDVAERTGISARTLRTVGREAVGLSPRWILRIRRLQAALLLGLRGPGRSWGEVAVAAGYHDQPHLIRECRTMMGETPVEFATRRGD